MINLIIKLEANLFFLKSKFIPYIILFLLLSCNSKQSGKLSYLALGDSYTIGESVDTLKRYPNQFVSLLQQRNILIDNPLIIAKTGWTTDELKKEILSYNIKDKFDLVSLLIGVNNQYRGRSSLNFKEEFEDLLIMAIQFTKSEKVTVLTIPDWGKTPFARDRNTKSIEDSMDDERIRMGIVKALKCLSKREELVLRLRFGISELEENDPNIYDIKEEE